MVLTKNLIQQAKIGMDLIIKKCASNISLKTFVKAPGVTLDADDKDSSNSIGIGKIIFANHDALNQFNKEFKKATGFEIAITESYVDYLNKIQLGEIKSVSGELEITLRKDMLTALAKLAPTAGKTPAAETPKSRFARTIPNTESLTPAAPPNNPIIRKNPADKYKSSVSTNNDPIRQANAKEYLSQLMQSQTFMTSITGIYERMAKGDQCTAKNIKDLKSNINAFKKNLNNSKFNNADKSRMMFKVNQIDSALNKLEITTPEATIKPKR